MFSRTIPALLALLVLALSADAQRIVNVAFGPIWPRDLQGGAPSVQWNASLEVGQVFDKIVGAGLSAEFGWNRKLNSSTLFDSSAGLSVTDVSADRSSYYFPVSGFIFFDPIPKYRLHPVIRGSLGCNMMAHRNRTFNPDADIAGHGFYIGLIGRAGTDLLYDLGEHASVFGGFQYQWGTLHHRVENSNNRYYNLKQYGPGIRAGMSIMF